MNRIMPPTLFYACVVFMLLLAWLWPVGSIIRFPLNLIGVPLLVAGLGIAVWGSWKFEQVGTTIKTFDQPDQLVTDGLFRYSRNPIYLGFVLALSGVWVVLGALSPLLGVIVFVSVADRWYIPFEERMLAEEFGRAFELYRAQTRRWL
jgi:protein-S-isoprenylcysteine O-methyltransferase Ste14